MQPRSVRVCLLAGYDAVTGDATAVVLSWIDRLTSIGSRSSGVPVLLSTTYTSVVEHLFSQLDGKGQRPSPCQRALEAALADQVPRAQVITFVVAWGDDRHERTEMLGIDVDQVDAVLAGGDGCHRARLAVVRQVLYGRVIERIAGSPGGGAWLACGDCASTPASDPDGDGPRVASFIPPEYIRSSSIETSSAVASCSTGLRRRRWTVAVRRDFSPKTSDFTVLSTLSGTPRRHGRSPRHQASGGESCSSRRGCRMGR